MGTTETAERVVLGAGRSSRRALFADTHHPCLGSGRALPYSSDRGKKSVSRQVLDELKQQIPLLDYLQAVESKYWNVSKGWRSMMDSGHGGTQRIGCGC